MTVARRSLARQVQDDLRGRILDGTFPSGSQLPAEVDLAGTMGVSRTSLREAVQQLELDGLLIRRHGYGTFVRSSPMLHSALNVNQSATDLIMAHGMTPGTRDPQVLRAAATPHEAERLGLAEHESVIVLERVRTADGRPVVFTRDVIPRSLLTAAGVDIEELADAALSLYHFFAERLGITVVDGTAWIRPDAASKALADRLGASTGTATLVIEQVDRDATERSVLLTWEHYLADTFEFVVHRRGPGPTTGNIGLQALATTASARSVPQRRKTARSAPPTGSTSPGGAKTLPDNASADRSTGLPASPAAASSRSKRIGDSTTPPRRASTRRKT